MRSGRVIWIGLGALAVVVAACDARLDVIKTGERIGADPGGGGSGFGGAGSSAGSGADCGTAGGGGARTGDAREVRDMSDDEVEAWCQSYLVDRWPNGMTDPLPPEQPSALFRGYADGYAEQYCWSLPMAGCVMRPTMADCVANLKHSPCEGTIASLNDCVDTFFNPAGQCEKAGVGCEPFMTAPHCSETVVVHPGPPTAGGAGGGEECYTRVSQGCL